MHARARAQVAQSRFRPGGKVGSPPAGWQVRALVVGRYTRTRLASTGVPGGARRQPRTNADTKPRPELLRTTVQRACVPRPDHGGPSERPGRANWFRLCDSSAVSRRFANGNATGKNLRLTNWILRIFIVDKTSRLIWKRSLCQIVCNVVVDTATSSGRWTNHVTPAKGDRPNGALDPSDDIPPTTNLFPRRTCQDDA